MNVSFLINRVLGLKPVMFDVCVSGSALWEVYPLLSALDQREQKLGIFGIVRQGEQIVIQLISEIEEFHIIFEHLY